MHRREGRGRGFALQTRHGVGARPDLRLGVPRVRLHHLVPLTLTERLHRHEHSRRGEEGTRVLEHAVVGQRALDDEGGEELELLVGVGSLEKARHELVRGGHSQVEAQGVEHVLLHAQDLLAGVSLVGDVHEVANLRRPDLLVLGREEHRRHTNQLEVLPGHHLLGEEAIDQVVGEEERFRHKLELQVHLNEPIDQDGAHLVVDVGLDAHVVGRNLGVGLDTEPVAEDVVDVLSDGKRVLAVQGVDVGHLLLGATLDVFGVALALGGGLARASGHGAASRIRDVARLVLARALRGATPLGDTTQASARGLLAEVVE
mmetsp:Transcript_5840/g.23927  ORF Transcript_5840/g.23927 Transcript_5840/m.23927 type:complete len:316 (+) Transcript_5840:400-1347(+)